MINDIIQTSWQLKKTRIIKYYKIIRKLRIQTIQLDTENLQKSFSICIFIKIIQCLKTS